MDEQTSSASCPKSYELHSNTYQTVEYKGPVTSNDYPTKWYRDDKPLPSTPRVNATIKGDAEAADNVVRTYLLGPEMQQVYQEVCKKGTRKVRQTRLMFVGHFRAGKTCLKASLLHKPFVSEHLTTDGIDKLKETVVVDVETAINWKQVAMTHKEDFTRETARELHIHASTGQVGKPIERRHSLTANIDFVEDNTHMGTVEPHKTRYEEPNEHLGKFEEIREDVVNAALTSSDKEDEIRFNIWDFGGQRVYYTSHQTFLSDRAIYLLVMDISKSLDTVLETYDDVLEDTGAPRTAFDFLDFWLNSVHTHLAQRVNRDDHTCRPPVIIVCTKTDKLDKDPKTRSYLVERYIESIDKHLQGKPYYHHVSDILAVSNLETYDEGINQLRQRILQVAEKQPYWGEDRPVKWLLLANELQEQADRQAEPVLKLSDIYQIAKDCGVLDKEVKAFLIFHHNLGDLIYFDDADTGDIVIMSPQWLATTFSKVITQDKILKQRHLSARRFTELARGVLSENTAASLCCTKEARTLVKIMEKFDMLVPCQVLRSGGKIAWMHLVPCLLPRVNHERVHQDPALPNIHFKFAHKTLQHFTHLHMRGFLPHGFYHRLVSKCCRVRGWRYKEDMIFYDYLMIDVKDIIFSLRMVNNGITLSAFQSKSKAERYAEKVAKIRQQIQSMIDVIIQEVFPNLQCVPCLACNCSLQIDSSTEHSYAAKKAIQKPGFIPVPGHERAMSSNVFCDHHSMVVDTKPWDPWFGADVTLENMTEDASSGTTEEKISLKSPHMPILLDVMPHKLQDNFQGIGMLSVKDTESIGVETVTRKKNFIMFELVFSRMKTKEDDVAVKEAVCKSMRESSQYCPLCKQHKPASASQRKTLDKLRRRLVEDMEVTPVLDRLIEVGIVDHHIRELIEAFKTRRDRVDTLLMFIYRKHSQAQDTFMSILRDTNKWIFEED